MSSSRRPRPSGPQFPWGLWPEVAHRTPAQVHPSTPWGSGAFHPGLHYVQKGWAATPRSHSKPGSRYSPPGPCPAPTPSPACVARVGPYGLQSPDLMPMPAWPGLIGQEFIGGAGVASPTRLSSSRGPGRIHSGPAIYCAFIAIMGRGFLPGGLKGPEAGRQLAQWEVCECGGGDRQACGEPSSRVGPRPTLFPRSECHSSRKARSEA